MKACLWPLLTATAAGLVQLARAQAPAANEPPRLSAQVEHRFELAAERVDGLRLSEISGLAWDADRQELLAVSDRGRLFRLQVTQQTAAPGIRVMSARQIRLPQQAPTRLNAEALAWRHAADGTGGAARGAWTSTETGGRLLQLDPQAEVIASEAWPGDAVKHLDASSRHGVESLAWHPVHGWLVALQRPITQPQSRLHTIFAGDSQRWQFVPAGRHSHLKAIEALSDGTLLLLERLDLASGSGHRPVLRRLDPATCQTGSVCHVDTLDITGGLGDSNDNFEGLACTPAGRCWIASDSGPDDAAPTRIVQLQLHPAPGAVAVTIAPGTP